jgi:hypothetical protein
MSDIYNNYDYSKFLFLEVSTFEDQNETWDYQPWLYISTFTDVCFNDKI